MEAALGPGGPRAQQAELVWQADRLQRQVAALQEEREALAQHLGHMQDALAAAKEKGAPLLFAVSEFASHLLTRTLY